MIDPNVSLSRDLFPLLTTPMHPALCIPEIVEIVCAELEELDPWAQKDFAALARTCKAFQEPALDILWRKQDTLAHLVKCLPSDMWEEISPEKSDRVEIVSPPEIL